jgi:ankyrin repeat protein
VASILIEYGCDFEPLDNQGKTPIHRALANGHLAVVGILLDNGARSIGFAADNTTPLMAAHESYLLGNLGHSVLKRIEMVENAAALNEAQNKVEKELEKKKRKKKQLDAARAASASAQGKRKTSKKKKV